VVYVVDGHLHQKGAAAESGSFDVALPIDPIDPVALEVSPDGSWAAVAGVPPHDQGDPQSRDPEVSLSLVSLESGEHRELRRFVAAPESLPMAISPDGRKLAFVSGDTEIGQIDARSGRLSGEPVAVTDLVTALTYSPDGDVLFVADASGAVSLLNAATGELIVGPALGPAGVLINSLGFTPREDRLLAGASEGMVLFADPETARPVGSTIQIGSTDLKSLAISSDESLLVALDMDGSLHLWNLDSGRALGPPLRTDFANLGPVLLPDGQHVITGSIDGLLSWDLDPDTWRATACELAGRDLSEEEWATFLPDEPYRGTCSSD
jgi:WD40 repeat protein